MNATRSLRGRGRLFAVGALVALGLAACGNQDGSVSIGSGAQSATAEVNSADVADAEKLYDEIANGILPTASQTEAVEYLQQVTFQSMIIDCMAGKGFTYVSPAVFTVPGPRSRRGGGALNQVDPVVIEKDPLGLNETLAGLVENAKAGDPIVLETGADYPPVPEHEVPGWGEAVNECLPSDSALDERVSHPAYERSQPFKDIVDEALASDSVSTAMAAYPECIRGNGWPVKSRGDLAWTIRHEFEDLLVDASDSFSTEPDRRAAQVEQLIASDEWRRLDEARDSAASADASCRRDAHDYAFAAMLGPMRTFKDERGAEIEQSRADWAAFEQRANETPDPARS